jgi:predicted enzyme related to lactoylglutathione lyase
MFEGEPGGGLYPAADGEKGIKVYFEVDDIDAEIGRIRDAGGETEEKMPVPSMGWFAHAKDTEGNQFSVWQSDENARMPEGAGAQTASS